MKDEVKIERAKLASIVNGSAELVSKVEGMNVELSAFKKQAEDANTKVASLEKENSDLKKEAEDKQAALRDGMTKIANEWVDRGFLSSAKRDELVSMVVNNPIEALTAMNKIAMRSAAEDNGKAAGVVVESTSLDPVARFALGE